MLKQLSSIQLLFLICQLWLAFYEGLKIIVPTNRFHGIFVITVVSEWTNSMCKAAYHMNDFTDSKDSEEEDKIPDLPKYCFCHGRKWLILDFLRRVAELTDRFEISDNIMLGINNEEVMFYLWYLDCIGTLMYYTKIPDDEDVIDCFKNHVICFPQVIFDSASQRIVCSMSTLHAEGSVTKREQKGQFSLESIEILCKIEQVIDGLEKKELISVEQVIKLLKHVNLLCPIIHKEAVGEQITYLMPTVLDCATLDELTTPSSPDTNNPELLLITFKCGYIPTGILVFILYHSTQVHHKIHQWV